MYIDDTIIYLNLEGFPTLNREQEINKELGKLNICFKLNKLTLNMDKTKCMFFHKRRAVPPINLSMNHIPIDIVPHLIILVSYWINIYRGKPMLHGHWETFKNEWYFIS